MSIQCLICLYVGFVSVRMVSLVGYWFCRQRKQQRSSSVLFFCQQVATTFQGFFTFSPFSERFCNGTSQLSLWVFFFFSEALGKHQFLNEQEGEEPGRFVHRRLGRWGQIVVVPCLVNTGSFGQGKERAHWTCD